jgi:hypothetical protein
MKITYAGIVYEGLTIDEAIALTSKLTGAKTERITKLPEPIKVAAIKSKRNYKHSSQYDYWTPEEVTFLIRNSNLTPAVLAKCKELRGRTPQAISCRKSAINRGDARNLGRVFREALAEKEQATISGTNQQII